ncbi:SIR2 family protein [Ferrovibrio sp.]|uniref:SIR2 family protein n=1 Tax=Ferrovibrio sp. TaxID=1917215 RepID=UPI0026171239|nr:SIR2 family protein [Ferrovibrio sp.]
MMAGNRLAVSILAPLLRATEEPCPVLLLGAGASFRSGVPTAADAVKQIARLVYSERELGGSRPPERVKPSEWEPWLQNQPWFIHGADRLAENFPLAVEHLLYPADFRKRVILELMRPRNVISAGYGVLSDFVMRGLIRTILTTNFDPCLPDALRARQPHIRHIHEVNRTPTDFDQFNVFNKCQIVWLHGRAEHYSDKNAAGEIGAPDPELVSLLRPLLDSSPIIVIGYRGTEPSIMEGIFAQIKAGRLDFPHGVYWCIRRGETPHPNVEALRRRLGQNFTLLEIDGFDELLTDLSQELVDFDRYHASNINPPSVHQFHAFDERVLDTASLDDLDLDLALPVLRQYCEKLKRAPVSRDTLLALMREQGLLVQSDGKDKVTTGAILLFGKRPQDFFPHAVVAVTEAGKKREIYEGNLISQHRQLLEKLETPEVNPLLKVKKRRQHDEQPAYPPRALVELLVNMLVHRDYEAREPACIDIQLGSEIAFLNPGSLTKKLAGQFTIERDGRIVVSENVTDQRNPSLCDIFFGISAMERAGTGLIDVGQLMQECGGRCAFYNYDADARFEAKIAPPQASAGSRSIARSEVPTGMYILNAIPFSVIPDALSIIQLKMHWRERPRDFDFSECGTFVARGDTLWSFAPLPLLAAQLSPIIDVDASVTVAREEVEASPDAKRVLSWLLRNHWERHLLSFKQDGLILERGHKHRAYFEGRNGDGRTVVWNGQRKGNRRDVVKRRGEGVRTWFENEGISYEIVQIGGHWCVRIKPFYMFTGKNSRSPLPSFTRAAKATSRMKFDRNKNVEGDLAFWSSFLGRGNETINIGHQHVDDLILDSSFLTVEVPEIGLIDDGSEDQNRMPA